MKKILFLIILLLFTSGCTRINNKDYNGLINITLNSSKIKHNNKTFRGYSFYLPKGLSIEEISNNNVILKNGNYKMYLYIDLVSYYNKVYKEYKENNNAYYSKSINLDDKFGYLEINLWHNKKYLVEIMYNYAKIEVIVDDRNIKNVLSYSLAVLSSITYNDSIIENMIGEDILNYNELEFNIFETNQSSSGSIKYDENSSSDEEQNTIPDLDLIN